MKPLSASDLDLIEAAMIVAARQDFWAYRRYLNPTMKVGWWQQEVSYKLQLFFERLLRGERPQEVFEAPPQHGKSRIIVEFIAWLSGKIPNNKTIYASFSDRLGVRANLQLQRIFSSSRHLKVFPGFGMPGLGAGGLKQRNREQIEFTHGEGGFRNTTVRGSVTGESLDLGVIDDPLKGRLEANSETTRESTWEWMTDDFFTRFAEEGALLIILTRWHTDDPVGRLKEVNPELRIHKYPAIATRDSVRRKAGEPLFPEHKSLEFLLARKKVLSESSWESLYQQSPFIVSGGTFPVDKFTYIDFVRRDEVVRSVRYWDKAGTKDGEGAETAGTMMHLMKDGSYVIEDVTHGRWAALERERTIKATRDLDGYRVIVHVEQEPGSGGKESAESTIRNLSGSSVYADRPTGDKATRAEPYAAQVQGGNVFLVRGEWNREFIKQHQHFPNGKLKDFVDSASGAFIKVTDLVYDMEALS